MQTRLQEHLDLIQERFLFKSIARSMVCDAPADTDSEDMGSPEQTQPSPFEADFAEPSEPQAPAAASQHDFAAFESAAPAAQPPQPPLQPATPDSAMSAASVTSQQLEAAAAAAGSTPSGTGGTPSDSEIEAQPPVPPLQLPQQAAAAQQAAAPPPPPELPQRQRAMGVDEEVVHQLMQEIVTGSANVQEVAAEQIR